MAISKKQREQAIKDKAADFAESTSNLLAELKAGIEQEKKQPSNKTKKVNISFYANPKLHKELKIISANEDSNINALLLEGLELALKKRGKNMNDYLE